MDNWTDNDNGIREQLLTLAGHLFYQLARMFLRHNVLIPELKQVLAWSAVNAALNEPEFAINGRVEHKQTFSHAAVLTGMTRVEVKKASEYKTPPVVADGGDLNRIIRILAAWQTDEDYLDAAGNPIDLPVRGGAPSLEQLCRKHGRDTPVRAVADMLVKNGNATWRRSKGGVAAKRLQYVHDTAKAEMFSAQDALLLTQMGVDFSHSLQQSFDPTVQPQPRMVEGYFNDIAESQQDEALEFLKAEAAALNARCVDGLRKYRAKDGEPTVRLGIGAYTFGDAPLVLESMEDKTTTKKGRK